MILENNMLLDARKFALTQAMVIRGPHLDPEAVVAAAKVFEEFLLHDQSAREN